MFNGHLEFSLVARLSWRRERHSWPTDSRWMTSIVKMRLPQLGNHENSNVILEMRSHDTQN